MTELLVDKMRRDNPEHVMSKMIEGLLRSNEGISIGGEIYWISDEFQLVKGDLPIADLSWMIKLAFAMTEGEYVSLCFSNAMAKQKLTKNFARDRTP